jgi:hypothetical protein
LRADFNGLFGEILCLTHEDTCPDAAGERVKHEAGMVVTAFDEDVDERGEPDDLVANGASLSQHPSGSSVAARNGS